MDGIQDLFLYLLYGYGLCYYQKNQKGKEEKAMQER